MWCTFPSAAAYIFVFRFSQHCVLCIESIVHHSMVIPVAQSESRSICNMAKWINAPPTFGHIIWFIFHSKWKGAKKIVGTEWRTTVEKKVGERTRAVHITNHQCGRWQANYCVILIPAPALCVHVRAHIVPFCVRTTFFLLRSCFHSIPQWLYSRHVLHSVYYLRAFWIDAAGRCFRASGHTKRRMANKKTTTTKWNATVHFYGCVLAAWVLCVCLCAMHNANRKIDRLVCRSSIV